MSTWKMSGDEAAKVLPAHQDSSTGYDPKEGGAVTSAHQILRRAATELWHASDQHQAPPAQRAAEIGRGLPQPSRDRRLSPRK